MTRSIPWNTARSTIDLPGFEPGWVWLAGAGPGDPGLLTLHAMNALQQADVVVHDALVDERVLNLVRPGAVVEFAGKRAGRPSPRQAEISQRLIDLARRGLRVLRLKGGDPFMFGRGGEEALALVAAGVPFRIVPGVSSGLGGLAYAGIPVTHRDVNQAVTFVTGHTADGGVPDNLDWEALAKGSPVLVVFMGLRHIGRISSLLMAAGRSPEEPVAIVSEATTERQKVLETALGRAADDAAALGVASPALIVIGEVVRLRAGLDWVSALSGARLDPDPLGLGRQDRTRASG